MQEFKFDKKYIILMKGCLVAFIACLALGLALPFLAEEEKGNPNDTMITAIMCTVVFGFFTVLTWLTLKKLPYADVAVDDDGIWYMHLGKDQGLISWDQISNVKERKYLQCLDLLDSSGGRLLRIEFQLIGFESLRGTLNEKAFYKKPAFNQSNFSKGVLYHLFYLASVLVFLAPGLYLWSDENPILGYGAISVMVVFIIYEYFVTATGIKVSNSSFEITYPITKRNISFTEIENILITDEFHKGNRLPEVWVISKKSKKPFKLKQLSVDANVLYQILQKAAGI